MPRLYLPTSDLSLYPVAFTFPMQIAQLQGQSGALDRLLARASRRVDLFCKKRIGAPPTTTLSAGVSIGATQITVASTLGFDNGQEEAVKLNPTGGNAEILAIAPGGVQVSSWASPYPGTITLASPVQFAHLANESVQGCYQEVSTVGSADSSDVMSDAFVGLDQAAQLARAHAPQFEIGALTRVIFLKQYPIQTIFRLEHMLPIDTDYQSLDSTNVGIHPAAGYIRLPLGTFVLPEGLFRTTYTAGYANVPEEIAEATSWYAADEIQTMVSQGAALVQQGKRRVQFATTRDTKSLYVLRAEELLTNGNYRRTV